MTQLNAKTVTEAGKAALPPLDGDVSASGTYRKVRTLRHRQNTQRLTRPAETFKLFRVY